MDYYRNRTELWSEGNAIDAVARLAGTVFQPWGGPRPVAPASGRSAEAPAPRSAPAPESWLTSPSSMAHPVLSKTIQDCVFWNISRYVEKHFLIISRIFLKLHQNILSLASLLSNFLKIIMWTSENMMCERLTVFCKIGFSWNSTLKFEMLLFGERFSRKSGTCAANVQQFFSDGFVAESLLSHIKISQFLVEDLAWKELDVFFANFRQKSIKFPIKFWQTYAKLFFLSWISGKNSERFQQLCKILKNEERLEWSRGNLVELVSHFQTMLP